MSSDLNQPAPIHTDRSAINVLAEAGAIVASAEAAAWKEGMTAAHQRGADGLARAANDATSGSPAVSALRHAGRHRVQLEQEHNRLARRALGAAKRAAEEHTADLPADASGIANVSTDDLASILMATIVLLDSDAAVEAAVVAYNRSLS